MRDADAPLVDLGGFQMHVASSAGEYPIYVGSGLLPGLPALVRQIFPGRRIAMIADSNVGPLHGERIVDACRAEDVDVTYLTFPAGEASKNRKSWSILTDEMLDARLGRDSCVVAVGGGVTTDLAGFVAATYLRGVPVLQVPTSYLAMIDASVGGKTGVDVRAGKNLVGAFHAPAAVVADTDVLATLPRAERGQGLVEAVKHGAILDAAYFDRVVATTPELLNAESGVAGEVVSRSIELKATVVVEDEFEEGYRQVLNFGHTVGHAIEAAAGYEIGHGTAVAYGMIAEAEIGEAEGVTEPGTGDRLREALSPIVSLDVVPADPEPVLSFLGSDKKARRGRPRFVLLEEIGVVASGEDWSREVPDAVVRGAVTRLLRRS